MQKEKGFWGSNLGHGFKAEVVSFQGLNLVVSGISPISIHDEGDMLRDWALLEGPDEKLMSLLQDPFCWRRAQHPISNGGSEKVGRHGHLSM